MKKITWWNIFLMTALLLTMAWSEGKGQLLVENFDYPAGDSLKNLGWTAHSGAFTNSILVTSPGLNYTDYVGSNIGNAVTMVTSGEDVNKPFDSVKTGNIYAAFMVKVTAANLTGDYFFHLSSDPFSTSYFRGKVFVKRDASNKLAFGVSVSSNTGIYTGFNYDLDSTYLLVLKYSIISGASNDLAYLFVNPAISSTEPAPIAGATDTGNDPPNIGSVALRQGNASNAANMRIDGIRITQSWSSVLGFIVNDPPVVTSSVTLNSNTMRIVFNEPVDTSAENTAHYTGIPSISSAVRTSSLDTVILNLSENIQNGHPYTLIVSDIRDTAGLPMAEPYVYSFTYNNISSGIVINELYYNCPGGGADSLEFIELYNNTMSDINLGGMSFTHGVAYTFPDTIVPPSGYFILAQYPQVFARFFGFTPLAWTTNNLQNSGERVAIVNTIGDTIDAVFYQPNAPWPIISDNDAHSIGLINSDLDNSIGENWRPSAIRHDLFNGLPGWATPGQRNFVSVPELIEPADGIYFVTSPESGDNMTFRWNESIVPVGGSVYYVVELVDAVNNAFNTIYEGTDTTFDYSIANFDDWLASNNWPANDTAYGITWRVTACDSVNEFISDGFEMFPIRVNLAPSAFNLLEPADGFRWEVSLSSTDSMYYRWNASVDPESSTVYYGFEFDTTATMDSPFHDFYPIGTDTFYVDYAHWDAEWLQDLGLDSLTMYWRIIASDGDNETTSSQLWSVKYVLIPETSIQFSADLAGYQEVPPTPSTATGTGYFELNADSTELFYRIYVNGITSVAPSYIHNAAACSNGTGVYPLSFTGDSAVGTWTIPSDMVTELFNGNLYVNVQSAAYPSGEIRGQIRMGTAPVALNPARELNAIEFEESIELDWNHPEFFGKEKTYRFSDKQFSRAKKENRVIKTGIAGKETAGLNSYNIYRSTDGVTFSYYDNTDLLYYMDSTVSAGTTYWYFVSAVYTEGQAPPTDTVEATPSVGYSFVEGFNDTSMTVSGELPEGWTKIDADGGDEDPFWGEWRVMPDLDEWFTTFEGDGMMFINYEAANPNGLIDEWLISPRLVTSQSSMVRLSFAARASGDDWPDSMQVLVSTTTAAPDQFTPVDYFLVTGDWEMYDYDLMLNGVMPGDTFYVAFRYLIYDGGSSGNNSDMLMLDYVRIDGMPMTIGVDEPIAGAPKSFALFQNYPNPFNPTTSIRYDLKDKAKVTLKIYNTLGQEVRTLVSREQSAGQYTIQWDGKNNAGLSVSSGVYIYRIQAGDFVKAKKMMFIK